MSTGNPSPPAITARQTGDDDPGVVGETDQAVAVEGETGVVERRNSVKRPVPKGCARIVVVGKPEADRENGRRDGFEHRHDPGDPEKDGADVAEVQGVRFGLCDELAPEPDAFAHEQRQQCCQCHDAESADLNQPENHGVSERRPERWGVDSDQACDADSRDGCE
jgi:hypothetical protein